MMRRICIGEPGRNQAVFFSAPGQSSNGVWAKAHLQGMKFRFRGMKVDILLLAGSRPGTQVSMRAPQLACELAQPPAGLYLLDGERLGCLACNWREEFLRSPHACRIET